jgi:nucleoside-diphosphate-sugar epimerase
MTNVVVTGANGFIGKALCQTLTCAGYAVTGVVRAADRIDASAPYHFAVIGEIDGTTNWFECMAQVDVIVHLAAQVQVAQRNASQCLATMRMVNFEGTENLARQAAAAGVKRLVYVSTVKINGEQTYGRPFKPEDAPSPRDPYAISKFEAEQALLRVASETALQPIIIRPPLVYGPGVKGNFLSLIRWIDKGLPLPLARIDNRRSLIALDNLIDILMRCIHHPAVSGEIFLVSDGEDLSTPELIRRIAGALRRPARLWPVPMTLLRLAAQAIGKRQGFDRLCGSLQVDSSRARTVLGWRPPVPVNQALSRTVEWYQRRKCDERSVIITKGESHDRGPV